MTGLKSSVLVDNIKEIIGNDSYAKAIKRGSMIFRSNTMGPKDRAVYWTEHVLKFGGQHLHSYGLDMPWYEYLMLDILAFLLLMLTLALCLFSMIITFCLKLVCTSSKSHVKVKKH